MVWKNTKLKKKQYSYLSPKKGEGDKNMKNTQYKIVTGKMLSNGLHFPEGLPVYIGVATRLILANGIWVEVICVCKRTYIIHRKENGNGFKLLK